MKFELPVLVFENRCMQQFQQKRSFIIISFSLPQLFLRRQIWIIKYHIYQALMTNMTLAQKNDRQGEVWQLNKLVLSSFRLQVLWWNWKAAAGCASSDFCWSYFSFTCPISRKIHCTCREDDILDHLFTCLDWEQPSSTYIQCYNF